jgi:hypothetical protein
MLRDTVFELVEMTRDKKLYQTTDFDRGYLMGLHSALSLVQQQVEVFGLDKKRAGIGDFDPDAWLGEGSKYWDARPGGHKA